MCVVVVGVLTVFSRNRLFADVERAYVTDIFRRRGHHANFVWNGNTFIGNRSGCGAKPRSAADTARATGARNARSAGNAAGARA